MDLYRAGLKKGEKAAQVAKYSRNNVFFMRSRVPRFRFASEGIFDRVQRSAPPLAAKAAGLITNVTLSCGVTYEG